MVEIDNGLLKAMVPQFREWLETEGLQWREERREKDEFFAKYFSAQEIDNLEEGTLRELIHLLWAFNSWTNKDYLLEEMLGGGLPTIRNAFNHLLYGNEPISWAVRLC